MSSFNSLLSCFGTNNVNRTASLQPVQQPDLKVSSLNKLFASEKSQSISNTTSMLSSKECCTIETAQHYYTLNIKNEAIPVTKTRKPSSGMWMSIKRIFSSLFAARQSRENEQKLNEIVMKATLNNAVAKAHAYQKTISSKYWTIVINLINHKTQATKVKEEDAYFLAGKLEKLQQTVISSMQCADNKERLGNLDKERIHLNHFLPSVLKSFAEDNIDAALQDLLRSVSTCNVVLENNSEFLQIMCDLCEWLINAGASPEAGIKALVDNSAVKTAFVAMVNREFGQQLSATLPETRSA